VQGGQSVRRTVAPVDDCSNGKPVEVCSGGNPVDLKFKSAGFLFELRSTGATFWQTDRPPFAAAPRLSSYKRLA
jgi:hypothetical protein